MNKFPKGASGNWKDSEKEKSKEEMDGNNVLVKR